MVLKIMKRIVVAASGALLMTLLAPAASAQGLRLSPTPGAVSPVPQPMPVAQSGWYLRGDVAANVNMLGSLSQQDLTNNGGSFLSKSTSNTASVAVGVGYRINPNVRVDATWELRTGSNLKAADNVRIINSQGQTAADIYTIYDANLGSQVGLVSAYFDLGNWNGLTPFVGASIGVARNTVSGLTTASHSTLNFYSTSPPYALAGRLSETSGGYATDKTKYSFAWGLTAGLAYEVSDRLTLEMAYRYLNLGSGAQTNIIQCTCGTIGSPLKVGSLSSHDVKLGMRWNFSDTPRVAMAYQPVVAKY
jgi:opacity protein-like surface antigen